jgi:polar amino acid transport system substrate-binding protein
MKFSHVVLTIVIAVLTSIGTFYWLGSGKAETKTETTYARVMRTHTLRCGYMVYPPYLSKDPNTGKFSGIYYDYMEALGKDLNFKVDWAEEMGLGDMPAALEANRVDAYCNFTWATATRARVIDFSQPIFYDYLIVLARADDNRFDNGLGILNDIQMTIAVIEGATPDTAARHDFPKAKIIATPQLSGSAQQFIDVVDGKADVVIAAAVPAHDFMLHNPGKLRIVKLARPYRIYGNAFAFARGQDEFRRMIDIATMDFINNGTIEEIIRKYEPVPGAFLRLNPGYKE